MDVTVKSKVVWETFVVSELTHVGTLLIELCGVKVVIQVLVKPVDCECFVDCVLALGDWTRVYHAASRAGIIVSGMTVDCLGRNDRSCWSRSSEGEDRSNCALGRDIFRSIGGDTLVVLLAVLGSSGGNIIIVLGNVIVVLGGSGGNIMCGFIHRRLLDVCRRLLGVLWRLLSFFGGFLRLLGCKLRVFGVLLGFFGGFLRLLGC